MCVGVCVHVYVVCVCSCVMLYYLQVQEIDLKPNGRNIPVVEKNKKEYVQYVPFCVVGVAYIWPHPTASW